MTSGVTVAMLFNNGVIPKDGIQPGEIRSPYIKEKLYTTSSSPNEVQSDEEAQKIIGSITKYGLSAGAMYLIKRALENQKIQKRVREYSNFGYLAESVSGTKGDALRIFGGGRVTLTNLLMNTARMAEELSPFHILRTFQVSHILQPFATRDSEHFFDSDALAAQKNYFREMFKMHGERELTTSDFANGITYRSGKMLDSEGNVILKDARLVASEFTGINRLHDESSAYNRILSRFVARAGVSKNAEQEVFNLGKNVAEGAPPLTFIASSGNESSEFKWAKTVVGQAVAQGFNTVNEPVAFVEEMTGTLINKENRVFQFLKKYGKINPNAHQNAEIGELALGYIKHGATKLGALGLGYYVLDNASKVFGSDGSGYDKGVLEGLSASAVNAKIKYNEVVSDNFKEYVAEQEYMAPGSTSLLRLAGFPLAGAMAAGTYAYAERALPSFLSGTYKEGVRNAVQQSNVISGAVSDAVDHTILNSSIGRVTRTKQFAMRGALVGALLTLPFLPGALMGESSEDAKAEYYEGKDVAIKRNRMWFCLHPNTIIMTSSGMKFAKDIEIGDKMFNRHGDYQSVLGISVRDADEYMYEIRTVLTSTVSLNLTGNHEILTTEGWKRAELIKVGDTLIEPVPNISGNTKLKLSDIINNRKFAIIDEKIVPVQRPQGGTEPTIKLVKKAVNNIIDIDFNFGLMVGWFIAEGSMPFRKETSGLIEFSFHNSEENFARGIGEYLKNTFGANYTIYKNQGNGKRLRLCSWALFYLFQKIAYDNNDKIIPDMTDWNIDAIKGFLTGVFYGDGTLSKFRGKRSRWSITSSRMDHIIGIRKYLSIFGVYGSITLKRESGCYKLDLGWRWSSIANEKIGLKKELYRFEEQYEERYSVDVSSAKFVDGFIHLKVGYVDKYIYNGQVYDYTMDGLHEYAPFSFVVHNSGSGDIEGEGVKYFTKNWFNRLQAGNRDKILYGDGDTKESLNPFLHPFDYLRNPYRFEEMHKHDMPYPVWGMDVSVGGWAGKIFEKTIGQVIKPDIINPEMYKISGNNIQQGYEYDPNSVSESGDLGLYNNGDIQAGNYFQIAGQYTSKFKSLIDDNLATGKVNPRYDPVSEGFNYTFNAAQDFIGLKGWAMSGITSSLGVGDTDHSNQIARSGEATNFAREFQSWNLGGLFGGADVLRRIVPMSTEVTYDRVNPLSNQVSTTWLPNGNSNYTDFSKGAFWDKVENGYDRLPGAGYETYNPSLKGVNPEDYPDINKFEILSDVAYGSKEYFAMNKKMSDLYQSGEMEEQDRAKFDEIYIQNQERSRQKVFHEYKTDDDVDGISLWGRALGTMWETTTHNAELPTERLSFFRPAGKLLHQRTAVEDYQHTQLSGSDTALWNRPYDHFIRPFFSDVNKYFDPDSIPDHVQEKRNVDNYFDALEYYKQMKLYRENYYTNTGLANQAIRNAGRTLYGAVASGLDSQQDVEAAYSALSDNERAYFSSFVNAKGDDRARISVMVDGANESQMYKMLWERKDALENGENIHALLEQEESDLIKSHAAAYKGYQSSGDSRIGISFREYLQEKRAEEVISEATGIPDENFVGWDPRIEVNDIKLRTLQVSKADVKEYGYWKQDEQALSQNLAVLKETQVTTKLKSISNISARRDFNNYLAIKDTLHQQGIRTKDVIFSNTGFGDTDINIG